MKLYLSSYNKVLIVSGINNHSLSLSSDVTCHCLSLSLSLPSPLLPSLLFSALAACLFFQSNVLSLLSGVPLAHLRTRSTASLTCLEQQIHARGTVLSQSRLAATVEKLSSVSAAGWKGSSALAFLSLTFSVFLLFFSFFLLLCSVFHLQTMNPCTDLTS